MVEIRPVEHDQETYFKLTNHDALRPFFMSIVSDSDHWMFIASNGGLTAGRKNAEYAIFPYYTDDKLTESAEITGSKAILRVQHNGRSVIWEPFSDRNAGRFRISRNLYKSRYGNKILFEEINHDLEVVFRYRWSSSDRYGFVYDASVHNAGAQEREIALLSGLQNILPYGVESELQQRASNLVDAYKRTELHRPSGLGIYALSAIIVDKAEPSEALKANIAWSLGLERPTYLLSSRQLDAFRQGQPLTEEVDVKGEKGAYFVQQDIVLPARGTAGWTMVVNVNQSHAAVVRQIEELQSNAQLADELRRDIEHGTQRLVGLSAAADGLQRTADLLRDARHFANVLFNIMRGGTFDHNYRIEKWDLRSYLARANARVASEHESLLASLPEQFNLADVKQLVEQSRSADFQRLGLEYLPLKFSRRHGDPSRPWNRFSINTRQEDGSKVLDYEGNWRDIFQNWEALAHAYPNFMTGMICKFLNASTFDGYNPYRVTKGGFDWETIEPDDPWSYIGYWGDHQLIYLLKFLEFIEHHQPGSLPEYFDRDIFVYANVPYKIKAYQQLLANPKDTIDFDHDLDTQIRRRKAELGADGALLTDASGQIHHVNFIEKILATVLAKVSNFIPDGGIWMNTQRPEWNDANNALVGNGVSMVTLYYLRRFLQFTAGLWAAAEADSYPVSEELAHYFQRVLAALRENEKLASAPTDDRHRKRLLDQLGEAAGAYRRHIYAQSFSGQKAPLPLSDLRAFNHLGLALSERTIAANRRPDHLYHAYNLMAVGEEGIAIAHLPEMLEGQVAVLSSGYLSARESLRVLDAMKKSKLFREDQYSYLLYPNKELPGFLEKNTLSRADVEASALLRQLVAEGNTQIVERDVRGNYHFNGDFSNANALGQALEKLAAGPYAEAVARERDQLLALYEATFNHKAFTGRSGTFYGYEGLGSIYWHMVSKLLLAVQECCLRAMDEGEDEEITGRLMEHYYEISKGIGLHKSPALYGAFPTDPYSHTPAGKGAQQPGMTGQVKEDVLCRFGELGVLVREGQLTFQPRLLRRRELAPDARVFQYVDIHGEARELPLPAHALGFTYCQIPIIYALAEEDSLTVHLSDGQQQTIGSTALDRALSQEVFDRSGKIDHIHRQLTAEALR